MSRKKTQPKKIPVLDSKFKSAIVPKLINSIMYDGKKVVAQKIIYEAIEKIKKSHIKNLVVTDTIDNENKVKKARNIHVLTISNLIGEAIKRISNSTSVSDLFK